MFRLNGAIKVLTAATLAVAIVFPAIATGAQAARGGHPAGGHPRRQEVMRRDAYMNRRLSARRGDWGGHYGQLSREDRGIRQQTRQDYRKNGGYLTQGQTKQLNSEENRLRHQMSADYRGPGNWRTNRFDREHPRRAEVLGRDAGLQNRIQGDTGRLGGNYKSLMGQDASIRKQEQTDARANGGYITPAQKKQLNQEENTLRKDIKQDYKP